MKNNFRVGIGYDIHRLEYNRDLIIGGVKIPYEKGLLGHSDADVLIHSIIDSLLGALSLSDIGTLFPDNDNNYKDADSIKLLEQVYQKIQNKGYTINNIDSNIIAQEPKMKEHIPIMKSKLASVLKISEEDISIKAKTKEGLDSVGEKLSIEAQTVVMLIKA